MSDPVYVRIDRPEGYEDVHPTLLIEDAIPNPAWQAEDVTEEIAHLKALLREVEWAGWTPTLLGGTNQPTRYDIATGACPLCQFPKIHGHEKDCRLAAALEGR